MIRISLVIVAALLVTALLRKRSAALRHWVLAAAIWCAMAMPVLEFAVPSWHLPLGKAASSQPLDRPASAVVAAPSKRGTTPAPVAPPPSSPPQSASHRITSAAADLLRPAWIAGTAVSLFVLLVGLCRLAWLAARAQRVTDARWTDLVGPVHLLQSDHPTLLVTWGLARPRIILPSAASGWSDERMHIVLSHELAHIRRGDWFVQMSAELLRSAYWFNPLVWLACRRLRQESEQACDDAVMSCGVEGPEYAEELVGLARDLKQRSAWLPAPAMARPSSLERRVRAMLNARLDRHPTTRCARVATVLALLIITVPIAAAQNIFATFSGSVFDATGSPLPNATMALSNAPRQSKYEVRTSSTGQFEFVGLPADTYELTGQLMGFATLHEHVSVTAGQNLQRRIELHVGSLEETITVAYTEGDPAPSLKQGAVFKPADLTDCVPPAVGGHIKPPRKIRDMAPQYPPSLRGTGAEGLVVMDATIGLDGFLKNIDVRDGANPDLAAAAVAAVREWQYTQTLLNCVAVEVSMKITTRFTSRQ